MKTWIEASFGSDHRAPDEAPEGGGGATLTELDLFLRDKLALISQKSTLAVAIRYATSRWAGLTLHLDDSGWRWTPTRWSVRSGPSP